MTFPPADRETAIAAFGSAEAFASALQERGLSVVSSYFGDIEHAADVTDPATRDAIFRAAETEAAFLASIGASYLVAGLPMRRNNAEGDGLAPVDLATAQPIADIANEVGAITARHGITLALHTESHSVFWTPRDVDLFLLLTDPFLVAFCPDTGHIVLGGGDPVQLVSRHRERVVIAHWKDAAGRVPGAGTRRRRHLHPPPPLLPPRGPGHRRLAGVRAGPRRDRLRGRHPTRARRRLRPGRPAHRGPRHSSRTRPAGIL